MKEIDQDKAIRTVENWVTREITQWQFHCLVKFVSKNGADAFKRSSILKRINRGDIEGAIEEYPILGKVSEMAEE